jgi:eukaryotic-like serine/threonine-protein kinase
LIPLPSASAGLSLGRYVLFDEIASGGMATVHFGRLGGAAGFSRVVAIKRLHANYAKDPEFVAMFLDEARLAARVRHPNVVATLDIVAMEGETFLVMEYVHGESLAKLWRATRAAGKSVDPRVAATIMSGVMHGLHAAHEAKDERGQSLEIVHRDVSPQNILVSADGSARVLDFGVAKAAGRVQTTREGRIKGKLAYMPPEQLQGATVTRRTDVYAAAVVTWETLTGQRAFRREHEAAVVAAILAEPLPPPSSIDASVPAAFDEVVMRGLQRNPLRRYGTAQEMALDLERCAGVASMSEVAEWVHENARADLARRALRMAVIERMVGLVPVGPPSTAADETPTRPATRRPAAKTSEAPSGISRIAVSSTLARMKRRWLERFAVWAAVGIGVGSTAAVIAVRSLTVVDAGATRQTGHPVAAPGVGGTPPPDPAMSAPAVIPTSVPTVTWVPPVIAPSERKPLPAARTPRVSAPPAHAPAPAKAKVGCDPPFSIDESGHKHYKAFCLD